MLSDAFVALPGGFGTMDEFCEVLSWRQLRIHDKPIGLLNYRGYYDALLALFDSMVREGFIGPHTRALLIDATEIDELLEAMFERAEPALALTTALFGERGCHDALLLDGVLTCVPFARDSRDSRARCIRCRSRRAFLRGAGGARRRARPCFSALLAPTRSFSASDSRR